MPKEEFHFAAITKITMEHEKGSPTSLLKSCDLRLEVSKNLNRETYIDGRGLPRKEALKPITNALVHGLITNIKMGSEKGWWKDHEHIAYAIEQLQRAFVTPTDSTEQSTMEY